MYLPTLNLSEVKRLVLLLPQPEFNYFSKKLKFLESFKYLGFNFKIYKEGGLIAGPLFSAPQISFLLEILKEKGLREILALGWAGKLPSSPLQLGDLFLPVRAISLEGTSRFYYKRKKIFSLNKYIRKRIEEKLLNFGLICKSGGIISVDVPWRVEKSLNMFNFYLSEGWALDMETSALYAVSRFFGLKAVMLTFITDEIGRSISKRPEDLLQEKREKLLYFMKDFLERGFI